MIAKVFEVPEREVPYQNQAARGQRGSSDHFYAYTPHFAKLSGPPSSQFLLVKIKAGSLEIGRHTKQTHAPPLTNIVK